MGGRRGRRRGGGEQWGSDLVRQHQERLQESRRKKVSLRCVPRPSRPSPFRAQQQPLRPSLSAPFLAGSFLPAPNRSSRHNQTRHTWSCSEAPEIPRSSPWQPLHSECPCRVPWKLAHCSPGHTSRNGRRTRSVGSRSCHDWSTRRASCTGMRRREPPRRAKQCGRVLASVHELVNHERKTRK